MTTLPKYKASRHQGIEASRDRVISSLKPQAPSLPRGFSLIEVLMAIFILSIGMISIAALFPAGMVQQRQSTDEIIGPLVANNALSIIRRKVLPEDFGTYEQFGGASPRPTIEGDWPWSRPGFYLNPAPVQLPTGSYVHKGDISIFGNVDSNGYAGTDTEIPWNADKYGTASGPDPELIIKQVERYYPQSSFSTTTGVPARPQYVWDCAFRRFQGKVLVAIFVYRVSRPGGGAALYSVSQNLSDPSLAPLPIWLQLGDYGTPDGAWDTWGLTTNFLGDDSFVAGTSPCSDYDPISDQGQAWQYTRQWILDQNNEIHRVLSADCNTDTNQVEVELVRPVSLQPAMGVSASVYYSLPPDFDGHTNIVSDIWYIPLSDSEGLTLTPVYLTVKEL